MKSKITYGLLTMILLGGLCYGLNSAFGLFTPFNFWTARQDIKNGNMRIAEIGEMPLNFDQKQKLANSYGFGFYLFGCNVSRDVISGTEYYNKTIVDYLERIHGAGWWTKFQTQLDSIDNADSKIKLKYEQVDSSRALKQFDTFYYGQSIIDNKIKPTDNDETFACLDSLHTHNKFKTRQFFFRVYRVIAKKSDGALSEVIGTHLKNYLFNFPNECLSNYRQLDKNEKIIFVDFIAYEFYASNENKKEINFFFGNLNPSSFYINSIEDDKLLDNLRVQIIKRVEEMQD